MKFSETWLREWVNPKIDTKVLLAQLTLAGLEVENCELAAANFSGVVVAEVIETTKHPDADKLTVCQVSNGGETLQIVCGASNVRVGIKVPLAEVGASLPNDLKIKATKLRGVASAGMLCSGSELGLEESSEGLYELPANAPVGQSLRDYLQLDDQVIEIGITPNRGDCLSIKGVAREVFALNEMLPEFAMVACQEAVNKTVLPINLQAGQACPRYLGRVIKQVDNQRPTPIWMTERLRRAGIKQISLVVDCLNYVMLELGQPMHAFDFAKLGENIYVRFAKQGEMLTLLNEQEVNVAENTLVIADENKVLALAGVMGGLDSSVSITTQDIFLESAFFEPVTIAGKAKQYGLVTDSAYRFERGVDFELPREAIERATQLIVELAGGKPGPVTEAELADELPKREVVTLSLERVQTVLAIELSLERVKTMLMQLGMQTTVVTEKNVLQVVPPSHRFDIALPEDLIEEVARLYGYDRLPITQFVGEDSFQQISQQFGYEQKLKQVLVGLGFHEAITYSFIEPKLQQLINPDQEAVQLANPIASDMSVMRTSLWPGLLLALKYNTHRQQARVRLFEVGQCFNSSGGQLVQQNYVAGLTQGERLPEQWGVSKSKVDFFDLKGALEVLLASLSPGVEFEFKAVKHPALHPGQGAVIVAAGQQLGYMGQLHPSLAKPFGLKQTAFVFELNLATLPRCEVVKFKEISKFPSVRRDFAILVDESVPTECLLATIKQEAGELLVDSTVFDVFTGEEIGKGQRSIAFSLVFQHPTRTLQDEEIVALGDQVITALDRQYAAQLRD